MQPFDQRFQQLQEKIKLLKPVLVKKMAATAEYFIQENFQKQGFQAEVFQPWDKRNPDKDPGRPTLIGKGTGHLMRSPFTSYSDSEKAIITSSLPYSKIHNEGGQINHPSREGFLHFDKTPEHGLWRLGKTRTVKQVEKIKATIPVTFGAHTANMPKRQFMGPSPVLSKRIREMLSKEIAATFKIIK